MAVFKTDIREDKNEMIKIAAKEAFMSRQKFIEKLIDDAAKCQAKKVLADE